MGRRILGVNHLASLHPAFLFSDPVPEKMTGADFLEAYGETGDSVTSVDPDVIYPIRDATFHAVYENERVQNFVSMLSVSARGSSTGEEMKPITLSAAGRAMYEAHISYSRIGLGSPETDILVELGRQAGPEKGIYGAKITGGGSGGTVAFLTYGDGVEPTIQDIAATYQRQTGLTPQIFEGGLSPGALAFGHETLE